MNIKLSLTKNKRLKQKRLFDELFKHKKAKSFYSHPFKVFYLLKEELEQTKLGLSVPKRNFKLAVKRNLIKRRIKEAYRTNQYSLNNEPTNKLILFFIYTSKKILSYKDIEKGIEKALKTLNKQTNNVD